MLDTQISSHPRDRPPGLKHKPDAALHQLIGILPRSWHKHGVPLSRTEILVSRSPRNPACLSWRRRPAQAASDRAACKRLRRPLCDLIGLDNLYPVCDSLYQEYKRDEYAPPPLLKRMVASGRLGRKSGSGFYDYQ
jgi:hypothetical protein